MRNSLLTWEIPPWNPHHSTPSIAASLIILKPTSSRHTLSVTITYQECSLQCKISVLCVKFSVEKILIIFESKLKNYNQLIVLYLVDSLLGSLNPYTRPVDCTAVMLAQWANYDFCFNSMYLLYEWNRRKWAIAFYSIKKQIMDRCTIFPNISSSDIF